MKRGERQKATQLLTELARRDAADATNKPPQPQSKTPMRSSGLCTTTTTGRPPPVDARNGARWREWFAMPHVPRPDRDPLFAPYFKREWHAAFVLSLRNFSGDGVRVGAAAEAPAVADVALVASAAEIKEELQSAVGARGPRG